MNKLVIGLSDKTPELRTKPGFLLIDDGPIADVFLSRFKRARLFDPHQHSFDPLKDITPRKAQDFADLVYPDKDLMTYRDGKSALVRMLLGADSLDDLPVIKHKGYEDARQTMDDLLLSPILKSVLCRPLNQYSFKRGSSIVARVNRAELGDRDAYILGALLIAQFKGQIIVPDFGFYARDFHASLIRENRLIAGVHTLSQLDGKLRDMCLLMDKVGMGCTFEDAEMLAKYEGLRPDPARVRNPYNKYIDEAMGA